MCGPRGLPQKHGPVEEWSPRRPVTAEIAGSIPVGTANPLHGAHGSVGYSKMWVSDAAGVLDTKPGKTESEAPFNASNHADVA